MTQQNDVRTDAPPGESSIAVEEEEPGTTFDASWRDEPSS
jgi:hypothetical protein